MRFASGEPDEFDDPLTPTGELQVRSLAQHFAQRQEASSIQVVRVYSSPLKRALATADSIARAINVPLEVWTDLYEYKDAAVERAGLIRSEMQSIFPDAILPDQITENGWWRHADDANLEACYARGQRVAGRLQERADAVLQSGAAEAVVLVTHLMFADALVRGIANLLSEGHPFFYHQNAAITEIAYLNEMQRAFVNAPTALLYLNRVNHLSPELLTAEPGL